MKSPSSFPTRFASPAAALFFAIAAIGVNSSVTADVGTGGLLSFRGQTMGTTYSVKVAPPHDLSDDVQLDIDAELRRVNDQMSTYLRTSEITRFNESDSTDWFEVSPETATVVEYAQQVSEQTGGAFDITVAPLVDAWSFGPAPRSEQIPSDDDIEKIRQQTGYERLRVRTDPPGLLKLVPELRIDLSAIAKGHGVDRIVDLLTSRGATNVFVEIGGEVRAVGKKPEGPWKVGIQDPATIGTQPAVAWRLVDRSIATSGDYRNFFEVDGIRYSHTIDPKTGRPVTHQVASVSVLAESCMVADAWATAINVLGTEKGLPLAVKNNLDVLTYQRTADGFDANGVGAFAKLAQAETPPAESSFWSQVLPLAFVTMIFLGIVVTGMAVGVMFGRKAIGGSCGGLASMQNEDGSTSCSLCSNPSDACKELRDKMERKEAEPASNV